MKFFQHKNIFLFIVFIAINIMGQTKTNNTPKNLNSDVALKSSPERNVQVEREFKTQADSIEPDQTGMRDLTSIQLAKEMVPGWNVGNSLEAIGGETTWGNPPISQWLIDSIKAAGFNAVRIPVAWFRFSNAADSTIDEAILDRVEEVVNYVLSDGMYAIINEHWDNGWIEPTYAKQNEVNARLASMWKQIAVRFRDYDDHLLFAGTNEIHVGYNTPTKEYYTVQNSYNQTFVNAVRSTGGCNYYRHLLVQGYNTNIDNTVNYLVIPNDVVQNRLIVEVHYYDPYNFTLNENDKITQWGKNATDPKKTETWANEAYADGQFQKMKTKFIDKGYAVVLGEYGVIARLNLGSAALNNEYAGYRRYYMEYITGSIVRHGLIPFYWDNGGTGNYSMGIFNRLTGTKAYPDIVKAIIDAARINVGIGVNDFVTKPESFSLMQNYPNPFNPVTTISYSLKHSSNISMSIYDVVGREVLTVIDNEKKNPGMHLEVIDASSLSSGVYFYKLIAGDFSETKKMLLIK